VPVNIAEATVSGIDVEASYRTPLGAGEVSFRAIGSYTLEFSTLKNNVFVDVAGSVSTDTPNATEGLPKLTLTGRAQYDLEPVALTA
jgi:iron complex outermembrane receptor protein